VRLGGARRADEDIGESAEALGEQAQGDALSGARVAGEHGEAAIGDAELGYVGRSCRRREW